MATFVASSASLDDLPSIARLQYEACMTDPGFNTIFPGPVTDASLAHLIREYGELVKNDSIAHVMVAKDTKQDSIVSYAIWQFLPLRSAEAVEEEMLADVDLAAFPPAARAELGQRLIKNSIRKRNEVASECFGMGKPYAYLAAIGTDPQYQKQGAASKLMEWAIVRANDLQLPMYIEATVIGLSLYQKFGFQEYDRLVLDLEPYLPGDYANICMIKFPNAT